MSAPSCRAARQAILERHFAGWQGLAPGCSAHQLLRVAASAQWGEQQLGAACEPARSHMLDLTGYARAAVYVRERAVVLFDGMNPVLDGGWKALSDDLGAPDAVLDWVHGTTPMPAGERVYARRGITVFLNPDNAFVAYVSLYVACSADNYCAQLRPAHDKSRGTA